jgi:hypothetical protein
MCTYNWSGRCTSWADELHDFRWLMNRRTARFARSNYSARDATEHACPSGAIQNTQHPFICTQMMYKLLANETLLAGLLRGSINHDDAGPPGSFGLSINRPRVVR